MASTEKMTSPEEMTSPEGMTYFIGRRPDVEKLKSRLRGGARALLLYGQPMVGKARLAKQVAHELRTSAVGKRKWRYSTVNCQYICDWPGLAKAVSATLKMDIETFDEKTLADATRKVCNLLLCLKLDDFVHAGHCEKLARFISFLNNYDVITVVTSCRTLPLLCLEAHEVKPMTKEDALELLSLLVSGVNKDDYTDVIEHCHGLPPLVERVAQLVTGDSVGTFTVAELERELDRDPDMLLQGLEQEAEHAFSCLSHEVQDHVTKLAQLLDGTFSMAALQKALGLKEEAEAKSVLKRLREEASVSREDDSRIVHIQPLFLHHVRQMDHIPVDDMARLRVVTFLGKVLARAEADLYLEDQDTVYGQVQGEWPQLQHLLRRAIHCTEETFQAYLKVARDAGTLLLRCYAEEAVFFFRNMATAARDLGTSHDQAMLKGYVGMAKTHTRDMTGWDEAFGCFNEALAELRGDRTSPALPRLLAYVGSAYFRRDQLEESERYFKEALIACKETDADFERVVFLMIQIRSLLAITLMTKGRLNQARQLAEETLRMCEKHCPHHYQKPILLNTLGIIYERAEETQAKALACYQSSLAERRRFAKIAPRDLVNPLNNIAMQYSREGDYDRALECLNEAARIMSGLKHFQGAFTHHNFGQVHLKRGDYVLARDYFFRADEVLSASTPGHSLEAEVALFLAHVYITPSCGHDVTKAKKSLSRAYEVWKASSEDLAWPELQVILSAIQHLVMLDGCNTEHHKDMINLTVHRLEYYTGDRADQFNQHQSIMQKIANFDTNTTVDKEEVTSFVLRSCRACEALSTKADSHNLWQEARRALEKQKSVKAELLGSDVMKGIVDLDQETSTKSHEYSSGERFKMPQGRERSQSSEQVSLPPSSPSGFGRCGSTSSSWSSPMYLSSLSSLSSSSFSTSSLSTSGSSSGTHLQSTPLAGYSHSPPFSSTQDQLPKTPGAIPKSHRLQRSYGVESATCHGKHSESEHSEQDQPADYRHAGGRRRTASGGTPARDAHIVSEARGGHIPLQENQLGRRAEEKPQHSENRNIVGEFGSSNPAPAHRRGSGEMSPSCYGFGELTDTMSDQGDTQTSRAGGYTYIQQTINYNISGKIGHNIQIGQVKGRIDIPVNEAPVSSLDSKGDSHGSPLVSTLEGLRNEIWESDPRRTDQQIQDPKPWENCEGNFPRVLDLESRTQTQEPRLPENTMRRSDEPFQGRQPSENGMMQAQEEIQGQESCMGHRQRDEQIKRDRQRGEQIKGPSCARQTEEQSQGLQPSQTEEISTVGQPEENATESAISVHGDIRDLGGTGRRKKSGCNVPVQCSDTEFHSSLSDDDSVK